MVHVGVRPPEGYSALRIPADMLEGTPGTGADTRTCAACTSTLPSFAPPPPRSGPGRSGSTVHPSRPPPFPACAPVLHIRVASNRPLASTTHACDLPNQYPRTRQTPAPAASLLSPTLRCVLLRISVSCHIVQRLALLPRSAYSRVVGCVTLTSSPHLSIRFEAKHVPRLETLLSNIACWAI